MYEKIVIYDMNYTELKLLQEHLKKRDYCIKTYDTETDMVDVYYKGSRKVGSGTIRDGLETSNKVLRQIIDTFFEI